jgi:hypothetical protein
MSQEFDSTGWYDDFLMEFVPFAAPLMNVEYPPPAGKKTIFTSIQAESTNFIAMINGRAGEGWTLQLPCMILDFGDPIENANELGMSVLSLMRMPITVTAVYESGGPTGTQGSAFKSIFAVKKGIEARPSTFLTFTRIEQGSILTSKDSPLNRDFRGDSQAPIIAASLSYRPGFVVQLY